MFVVREIYVTELQTIVAFLFSQSVRLKSCGVAGDNSGFVYSTGDTAVMVVKCSNDMFRPTGLKKS